MPKKNYKGIIEFSIDDFNEIGFSSSQPMAVLMDDETKSIANDYGFYYTNNQLNPEILVFINRIEDISNTKVQRYRMYSYEDNKLIIRGIEIPNDNIELSKRIAFVMQNRENLLQEYFLRIPPCNNQKQISAHGNPNLCQTAFCEVP